MRIITVLITVIFICTLHGCQVNLKQRANIPKNNIKEIIASNKIDFEIIKEWVKDKRIVAIGESTHGLGEFYALKTEMIKFLHKELGYDVLMMEGSFGDLNLAWLDIENLTPIELRNKTLFGNFKCKEIEPLFVYLKDKSKSELPLFYSGFDMQSSGDYYENNLDSISRYLKLEIDLKGGISAYYKMYQATTEPDSTNFIKYRNIYQNTLLSIKKAIINNKSLLLEANKWNDLQLKIILQNIDMQYKAVDYSFSNKFNSENLPQAIVKRDEIMAENVKWMIDSLYPNKKILIWGHNGHIQKGGIGNYETKMMGQLLADEYGEDYYSIGLFVYQGKAYQHWTGQSIEFENSDTTSIEYLMKKDNYKYTFQRFGAHDVNHWTNLEVMAYEIESVRKVSFIPSQRFDAGICIYSGDIPTFIKSN